MSKDTEDTTLTFGQIRWAMSHDWADSCSGHSLYVWSEEDDCVILWTKGFSALREWAGY